MGRARGNNGGEPVRLGRKRPEAVSTDEPIETPEVDDSVEDDQMQSLDADQADQDWREDGPFDLEEVDLSADQISRIDLGTLIITPWEGLNLQLQVDEATRKVLTVTGVWAESGLEVALFAAPASGGLAEQHRAEATQEATEAGGTVEEQIGPFGPELRRVIPQPGPKRERMFHVSRVWYAEGPRWMMRGTLLGEAALDPEDASKAAPFEEFFRNLVVRRGSEPRVPGEPITMTLPQGAD